MKNRQISSAVRQVSAASNLILVLILLLVSSPVMASNHETQTASENSTATDNTTTIAPVEDESASCDNVTFPDLLIDTSPFSDAGFLADNYTRPDIEPEIRTVVTPERDVRLVSRDGEIMLDIPKGAVSEPVEVSLLEKAAPGSTGTRFLRFLELNASPTDLPPDDSTPDIPFPSDNLTGEPKPTEEEPRVDTATPGEETTVEPLLPSDNITVDAPSGSDNFTSEISSSSDNVSINGLPQSDNMTTEATYLSDNLTDGPPPGNEDTSETQFISDNTTEEPQTLSENLTNESSPGESEDEKVFRFNKELQLYIKHTRQELRGLDLDSIHLYYLNEETKQWVIVPGTFNRETLELTATLTHFSYYGEQANPLQNGPGRVMASQVDLHSGAATFSYPFELPPGPGGFQPKLDLTYNSASVDEMKNERDMGSWVGIGWELHPGRISRDLLTDEYYLDLNGASYRLFSSNGTDFHTQPEQYYQITFSGNNWSMLDKEGNEYIFGGTNDSKQYVYEDSREYYRWDLSKIEDTNGNTANITYTQEKTGTSPNDTVRSAYSTNISYGNTTILFTLGDDGTYGDDDHLRKDNPRTVGDYPAPKMMETRRLNEINVMLDENRIRRYVFSYTTTDCTESDDYGGEFIIPDTINSIT